MLKSLFILSVLVLFGFYCYNSVVHYSSVPVPGYAEVKVDLFGGLSQSRWKNDPTAQNDIIQNLALMRYQPLAGGLALPSGRTLEAGHILTVDDIRRIIAEEPASLAKDLPLRDPSAMYALEDRGLTLRDNVVIGGKRLFAATTPVDKPMLDSLLSNGIKEVRVAGRGEMVAPQSGTMLMVVLIFLALLCALDKILYKPLLTLMDERAEEVTKGQELARFNVKEQAKLTDEEQKRRRALRRDHISNLVKARHAVMREADAILREANVEAHRLRDNAHMEMKQTIAQAETRLRQDVDALAGAVLERLRS